MNNIDIKNNFINQLKEKYKIIIGIVLFIFLLESAYQDYITILNQSNLTNLYQSIISIQAAYNFLRLLSEESNMNKLSEFKTKINKLLSFVDPSIDSFIGFNLEILYLLSILEQDFSNSLSLSNESQDLYQQIQEGDRISAFIKERVKKINDFQKYK